MLVRTRTYRFGGMMLALILSLNTALQLALADSLRGGCNALGTQQIQAEEEKIIAAFIWRFLEFIEFPAQQESFLVGFVGTSRVETFFSDIVKQKRTSNGQMIEARRITSLDDIARCQVVFVAQSENSRLTQILAKTKGKGILTIGIDSDFLLRGGMMNFYIDNAKVRFEYNIEEISAGKLRCSSQLLRNGRQYSKAKE